MNGLLDTGSTPVYSTIKKGFEILYFMVFRAFFIAILQYFKIKIMHSESDTKIKLDFGKKINLLLCLLKI